MHLNTSTRTDSRRTLWTCLPGKTPCLPLLISLEAHSTRSCQETQWRQGAQARSEINISSASKIRITYSLFSRLVAGLGGIFEAPVCNAELPAKTMHTAAYGSSYSLSEKGVISAVSSPGASVTVAEFNTRLLASCFTCADGSSKVPSPRFEALSSCTDSQLQRPPVGHGFDSHV